MKNILSKNIKNTKLNMNYNFYYKKIFKKFTRLN